MINKQKNNNERDLPKEGMSRREALGRIKDILVGVPLLTSVIGCEEESVLGGVPEETAFDVEKYADILDTYENLQNIKQILSNTEIETVDGYKTAYRVVMEILGNSFNPEHFGFAEYKERVQAEIEKLNCKVENKVFIMRVVQSLWTEANGITPWSLEDYSAERVEDIFYVPNSVQPNHSEVPYENIEPEFTDNVTFEIESQTIEIDSSYQLYYLAKKLMENDSHKTIYNAIRWVKANFLHYHADWPIEEYEATSLTDYLNNRISGCHDVSAVMVNLLKALNIPAYTVKIEGHGFSYFPTLQLFLNGDHLTDTMAVSPDLLLLNADQMREAKTKSDKYKIIHELIEEKYGDTLDIFELSSLGSGKIQREGNGLWASLGSSDTSDKFLEIVQEELSHLELKRNEEGRVVSDPMPIKSLEELSAPNVNIW